MNFYEPKAELIVEGTPIAGRQDYEETDRRIGVGFSLDLHVGNYGFKGVVAIPLGSVGFSITPINPSTREPEASKIVAIDDISKIRVEYRKDEGSDPGQIVATHLTLAFRDGQFIPEDSKLTIAA